MASTQGAEGEARPRYSKDSEVGAQASPADGVLATYTARFAIVAEVKTLTKTGRGLAAEAEP